MIFAGLHPQNNTVSGYLLLVSTLDTVGKKTLHHPLISCSEDRLPKKIQEKGCYNICFSIAV